MDDDELLAFSDEFNATFEAIEERARAAGLTNAQLADEFMAVARRIAPDVADGMDPKLAEMAAVYAERRSHAADEIAAVYDDALARFLTLLMGVEEIGRGFHLRQIDAARARDDTAFSVLSGLMVGAVKAGHEIHHLLRFGHVVGASARVRFLHESAAIANVIGRHRNDDTADRFAAHIVVDQLRWARHEVARFDGDVDQNTVADLEREQRELCEAYGSKFSKPYGWMAHLHNDLHARALRELAGMEDWAADVTILNQAVHPSSWGSGMNIVDDVYTAFGRTTGVAPPAEAACLALTQTLTMFVTCGTPEKPTHADVIGLATVQELMTRARSAFGEAAAGDPDNDTLL